MSISAYLTKPIGQSDLWDAINVCVCSKSELQQRRKVVTRFTLEEARRALNVLLVEDIIDTGLTLNYLLRYLRGKNPRSIKVCSLLDKPARRLVEIPLDYVGFEIPDAFVVGYGLDYGEVYRNLRFVGVLRPEAYES